MGIVKTVGVTTMIVFAVILSIMIVMEVEGKYIINKLEEKNKSAKEEDKRGPVKILVIAIFTIIGFAICIAFRFRFISFASDCMGEWSKKPYELKAVLPKVIQDALAGLRKLFRHKTDNKSSVSSNDPESDEVRTPESTNLSAESKRREEPNVVLPSAKKYRMKGGAIPKRKKSKSGEKLNLLSNFKGKISGSRKRPGQKARIKLRDTLSDENLGDEKVIAKINGRLLLGVVTFFIVYKWTMLILTGNKQMFGSQWGPKQGLLFWLMRIPHIFVYMLIFLFIIRKNTIPILLLLTFDLVAGIILFALKYGYFGKII